MKKAYIVFTLVLGTSITGAAWSAVELAKVNGRAITDRDLQIALSGLNQGQRDNLLKDVNNRRELLVKLIDQELLAQQAEKEKLDQVQEYKETMDAFKKQLLSKLILEKKLSPKLTDKAARKYFSAHSSRFSTDKAHVQHILLPTEEQAREVLAKVKEPGTDFQELAEKLSKDPSAKNNRGDIGIVTHDSPLVREFKDAAMSGKTGEIVGPIKTLYGYHIIKIVEKQVGKPQGYDEVELKVKSEFQQEVVAAYVSELKVKAKVQVDEKALQK